MDSSKSFECWADAGGQFEGYSNDGDFDLYVNGKCNIQASTIRAHGALSTYSGHVADYYPLGYGVNFGKNCNSTVVCGDSVTNWACGPCDGRWSYRAIVDITVPSDY